MATKLSSPRSELQALRAMCHQNAVVAGTILAGVDETYFSSEESKEVYHTLLKIRGESGRVPKYKMVLDNPELSKAAADFLRNSDASVQDKADAQRVIKTLNVFRRRRGLANIGQYISDQLNGEKPDTDKISSEISAALASVRAGKSNEDAFLHFGKNDNAAMIVDQILYGDNSQKVIPTGFKTFDDINGGFFRGSLITLGGTTSGGKSTLATQLAKNIATAGYKVHVVPLEMSKEEMTGRLMSNVAKFDSLKIQLQRMTEPEKEMVKRRFKLWRKKMHAKGGRYTVYKPPEDITIEDLMASLDAYSSDVVIIDYISLLKGVDGDDQWRALGAVARFAKINAENTNRVIILLAQVDQEGKLRYSRAVQEHANNSWIWVANKETREMGVINIEQPKARNQKAFPFTLKMDSDVMRVYDMPSDGVAIGNESIPIGNDSDIPNLAVA